MRRTHAVGVRVVAKRHLAVVLDGCSVFGDFVVAFSGVGWLCDLRRKAGRCCRTPRLWCCWLRQLTASGAVDSGLAM
ncbi:MAG: hypothetical protein FWD57_01875 [Polyangiaceae bacterium]|nr:hypothetical protein [Polyangiaceae bacterium]